jgi:CheY-like chemotaxis protein
MTSPGRILVVDDSVPVRALLTEYLETRGYAVVAAASGPEALIAFVSEQPDVVLLDIRMPGMDGCQVLRRLRQADPGVPVIMVTANEDEVLARETLSIGAFDYVAKPFDLEHVGRIVTEALLHSERASLGEIPHFAEPDELWSRLVTDVFRVVRGMGSSARASTGTRLEDAALGAARQARAGRSAEAAQCLDELAMLVGEARRFGDFSEAGRSVIERVLESAQAALSRR